MKPIAQMAVALWVATSLFWGAPDLVSVGRITLPVAGVILFDALLGLTLCGVLLLAALRLYRRSALARAVGVGALALVLAVAHAAISAEATIWMEAASGFNNAAFLRIFSSILIDYLLIYALFATAASLLLSQMELRHRDQRIARAESTAQQAQLAALRHQLNPHFMFNTLNAVGSLIATGRPERAQAMLDLLSEFLRSSLTRDAGPFTTLDDELATIQSYLEIEAVRFGDRLTVRYDYSPELGEAMVPSFILQPLVENAVKHAVGPAMRPVTVRIAAHRDAEDLVLMVEDSGAGAESDPAAPSRGAGIGVANTRERLSLLFGSRGRLEAVRRGEGFIAIARLPLSEQAIPQTGAEEAF